MFWVLFVIVVIIGCSLAWLVDLFQQMKTSEYEAVRIAYWFLVTAFWILILIWLYNLQGEQVGRKGRENRQGKQVERTGKISLASQKKDVILIV